MTDLAQGSASSASIAEKRKRAVDSLKARHGAETRFRMYGVIALALAIAALGVLLVSIVSKGYSAFYHTQIELEIDFNAEAIDPDGLREKADGTAEDQRAFLDALRNANLVGLVNDALYEQFPEVSGRRVKRELRQVVSSGSDLTLRNMILDDPSVIGTTQSVWFIADDEIDMLRKGYIDRNSPQEERSLKDSTIGWYDTLVEAGKVKYALNWQFLSGGTSREPEIAGIWGALVGSFWTMVVTLLLAFPVGVAAALYLEEFAPKNKFTDLIEVNINNLAAVPSIVFGLLGLAVFIQVFGVPRSTALIGGMVLALMSLPTIIIAARAALKAVPPSIREAALGMGASRLQTVTHHVLPLALPGIMTGTIIAMAQALGETAPLLMIGMVAFVVDIPGGPLDSASVMPVQIYLWSDIPERAFVEKTSAAIMALLGFLVVMNLLAVTLRKRFERRW